MIGVTAEPRPEQQPIQLLPGRDPTEQPADGHFALDHLLAALVVVIVAGGLAVLAHVGPGELVAGVAVAQAALIVAWVLGTGLPGRIGATVIAAAAAAGADAGVAAWPHSQLGPLIGVLGLAVPAMFVHQLARGVVRARVVESLSGVAVAVVGAVALAALVQLRHETDAQIASTTIAAAGAALAAGFLVDAIWAAPRFDADVPRGLTGVVVSMLAGAAVSVVRLHDTVEFSTGRAALLGAAVGAVGGLLSVGVSFVTHTSGLPTGPARALRPVIAAVLPLAILAPVAYVLCLAVRA
jgi:hypothetical protein